MIGIPKTGTLDTAVISAVGHEGLTVTTADGKPAQLAVIDENGKVIAAGPAVAQEAWNITIATWKNFLIGKGHLRIFSRPSCEESGAGKQAA